MTDHHGQQGDEIEVGDQAAPDLEHTLEPIGFIPVRPAALVRRMTGRFSSLDRASGDG